MSTNHTTNYNLCQWEPTDPVVRTDFNADNARLEAALSSLEERVAELYRAVPNLAYNVYDLALKDYQENKVYGYRRSLIIETFLSQGNIASMTGDLVVQNQALVLTGPGKTATMTSVNFSLTRVTWTRVVAWLKYALGGYYSMTVNGQPLTNQGGWDSRTVDGIACQEVQFAGDIPGMSSAQIGITLQSLNADSATVYEYGVMFF